MKYAKEYKEMDALAFVEKYGLVAFLDEYMEDVEGRHERFEKWRQENKCCENCQWYNEGCGYWGGDVEANICGQWR